MGAEAKTTKEEGADMKIRWPFVWRKTHDEQLRHVNSSHQSMTRSMQDEHKKEIEQILKPFVDKFIHLSIKPGVRMGESFRFCVDMDTYFVERCMCHGNSDREIAYFADVVGESAKRKIAECIRVRNYRREYQSQPFVPEVSP